jgi:hypothetical protein
MSAASTIGQGRRFNEALMASTCVIADAGSEPVLNEETGEYEPVVSDPSYEGPCKIRFNSSVTSEVDAQSQLLVEQNAILSLPVEGSGNVSIGQYAVITANPMDAAMVGKKFRITGDHTQTFATARRFPVELVTDG